MAILPGSRYSGVSYTGVKGTDGITRKYLHDRRVYTMQDIGDRFVEHVVVGEEILDALAERYYQDQNLWWFLADVNEVLFPLDVTSGMRLKIPHLSVLVDLGLIT